MLKLERWLGRMKAAGTVDAKVHGDRAMMYEEGHFPAPEKREKFEALEAVAHEEAWLRLRVDLDPKILAKHDRARGEKAQPYRAEIGIKRHPDSGAAVPQRVYEFWAGKPRPVPVAHAVPILCSYQYGQYIEECEEPAEHTSAAA